MGTRLLAPSCRALAVSVWHRVASRVVVSSSEAWKRGATLSLQEARECRRVKTP